MQKNSSLLENQVFLSIMKFFAKRKCHKNADTEIVSNVANVVNENSFLVCIHIYFSTILAPSKKQLKYIQYTCPVLYLTNILEHEFQMNYSTLAIWAAQDVIEKQKVFLRNF